MITRYSEPIRVLRRHFGRTVLGSALILHAFGHAAAAISATNRISEQGGLTSARADYLRFWIVSLLVTFTMLMLLAGGIGALPGKPFAARWRALAAAGLFTSIVLLSWTVPEGTVLGIALNIALLIAVVKAHRIWTPSRAVWLRQRSRRPFGLTLLVAAIGFITLLGAARPVFMRWGTRPEEAYIPLPGDRLEAGRGYEILHAVDIEARPDQIWPWIAQLGQDRGGFYSHAWLENLFGLGIDNADQIVGEWQNRQVGEILPATPPGWLGLRKPLGWRVLEFQPNRVLSLENWGAFALVPIDQNTTRFYIRTQGHPGDRPSVLWSPIEMFVFQPVHFIMQRQMMLGIKERAERATRVGVPGPRKI